MLRKKEILMGAGTLACALGAGVFMQTTDTAEKLYGSKDAQRQPATAASDSQSATIFTADGLMLYDVTETSATPGLSSIAVLEEPVTRQVMPEKPRLPRMTSPEAPAQQGCAANASAQPTEAGIVTLSLDAPCHADAQVTIRHGAVVFTALLDDMGQLTVDIPALSSAARFDVSFDEGTHVKTTTYVDDTEGFHRVALQWQGQAGFELHAREFGALYGGVGHIWHGASSGRLDIDFTRRGHLHRLGHGRGEDAQITEIYTFPANTSLGTDQVDLTIEAEVTSHNCGRTISAQALEFSGAQTIRNQMVTFAVPGCDAIGDFLVLNNAFEDLKLAAR